MLRAKLLRTQCDFHGGGARFNSSTCAALHKQVNLPTGGQVVGFRRLMRRLAETNEITWGACRAYNRRGGRVFMVTYEHLYAKPHVAGDTSALTVARFQIERYPSVITFTNASHHRQW